MHVDVFSHCFLLESYFVQHGCVELHVGRGVEGVLIKGLGGNVETAIVILYSLFTLRAGRDTPSQPYD